MILFMDIYLFLVFYIWILMLFQILDGVVASLLFADGLKFHHGYGLYRN